MAELTDEQLSAAVDAALPMLDAKAQKALTFTRWRDGIDIEYPTVAALKFAEAIYRHLSAADGVSGLKPFAHCDCPNCDAAGVEGRKP